MGTSFIIPMLFLIFPFSDMVVNGMENDREDMRMRLKEEIKLELVEEMRREAQEDVESLLEKRLADLREELEEELLGKLMRNGSLGMIVAASTPQHIVCATQVLTGTCLKLHKKFLQLTPVVAISTSIINTNGTTYNSMHDARNLVANKQTQLLNKRRNAQKMQRSICD